MKRTKLISILLPIVAIAPVIYLTLKATPCVLAAMAPFDHGIHHCKTEDNGFFRTEDGGCKDLATGLVWSLAIDNWDWPLTNEIGQNLEEGGFTDWRLPTIEEMQTAHAHGAPTHFDPGVVGIHMWSSETRGNKWAWKVVLMGDGSVDLRDQGSIFDAMFVRRPVPVCGNGILEPGETPCNCPADAGDPPATETNCSDGIDNDCDGLIDGDDPDCDAGALLVDGIFPNSMPAGGSISVTISGTGFAAGASVTFENGKGATPTASGIIVAPSGTEITATITVGTSGPPRPRVWDVRITIPDSSTGVLADGFTVVP